jgi:hypothetical protein
MHFKQVEGALQRVRNLSWVDWEPCVGGYTMAEVNISTFGQETNHALDVPTTS